MGDLAELDLQTSYRKGRDDLARDFYLPLMRAAATYDRAVGFFRSSVFIIAWPALTGFVERGGKMRILCSQVLSEEDVGALNEGYEARLDELLSERLTTEIETLLTDEALVQPTRILAALVASGVIDLKVAVLFHANGSVNPRIFHDKLGIVRDVAGSVVAFKGSMNETWGGLAADGNLESVDVYCEWNGGREAKRVAEEAEYFATIWDDNYPGVEVREFPQVPKSLLVNAAAKSWPAEVKALLSEDSRATRLPANWDGEGRTLLDHQEAGLSAWRAAGRRGIFAFATGAGKTFTALNAIHESIEVYGEVPVVVVPDMLLFRQWHEELQPLAAALDASILRAGAGHDSWRGVLRDWTLPGERRRIVLTTIQTARSADFRMRLATGAGLFLVADEVHHLGSPSSRSLLDDAMFGPRLGLSATPDRAGDPEGSAAIMDFFGEVLEPRYTLVDAIEDKVLTPYFYYPHAVRLSDTEARDWAGISARIARVRGQMGEDAAHDERLDRLYFERARIVKQAASKVQLSVDVIARHYRDGERWLIYCDDQDQLENVRATLHAAGHEAMPYHSAMGSDRQQTLRWLERFGGIVIAIKCLDEGVDIPAVSHALILASSKNPREFIQRRGRVLRRAKGKALAHIHDAIVVPPTFGSSLAKADPITAGELARAIEFAHGAENPMADADLLSIALDSGLDWHLLAGTGLEDIDDD